jgi:ABC-type uncharacterized transport system permease subunit
VLLANQVATGLALTLFGLGFSALLGQGFVGIRRRARRAGSRRALGPAGARPDPLPHDPMVYVSIALVAAVWYFLNHTRGGLILRAVGENHDAAHALGYNVRRVRILAIAFGGACAGLGGAYLSLIRVPQWTEGMTAGAGWIALALVVFSSWRPWRVLLGAYLFGGIIVLQLNLQAAGIRIPVEYLAMSPYLVTILVLVVMSSGRGAQVARRARIARPTVPRLRLRPGFNQGHRVNRPAANREKTHEPQTLWPPLRPGARGWRTAAPRWPTIRSSVGFIYIGPVGDTAGPTQHDQARREVEEHFGDRVETTFRRERGRRRRCRAGDDADGALGRRHDLRHLLRLWPRRQRRRRAVPRRRSSSTPPATSPHPNVSLYNARFYEGRAVIGHIAGRMTETNVIGYIASFPIPEW